MINYNAIIRKEVFCIECKYYEFNPYNRNYECGKIIGWKKTPIQEIAVFCICSEENCLNHCKYYRYRKPTWFERLMRLR